MRAMQLKMKMVFGRRYKKIQLLPQSYPWNWNYSVEFEYRTKYPQLLNQQFLTFYLKRHRSWKWDTVLGETQISLYDLCQSNSDQHQLTFRLLDMAWPLSVHFTCEFIQFFPEVELGYRYFKFEYLPKTNICLDEFLKQNLKTDIHLLWYKSDNLEFMNSVQTSPVKIMHQWDGKEICQASLNQSWTVKDVLLKDLEYSGILIHMYSSNQAILGVFSCHDPDTRLKLFFYDFKTRQSEFVVATLHDFKMSGLHATTNDSLHQLHPKVIPLVKTLIQPKHINNCNDMIDIFFKLSQRESKHNLWNRLLFQKQQWSDFLSTK
ncbi:MAG: hypothetical protein JSS80_12170 [Bacteroidetes bacterium]|nr:hypothetical protein [Bacteroidota bacterium]